jgi:hypothetical protein
MPAAPLEEGLGGGCEQTLHFSLRDLRRIKSGSHASSDFNSMKPLAASIIIGMPSSALAARARNTSNKILRAGETTIPVFIFLNFDANNDGL